MSDNLIRQQFKLLRFAILPGILGGTACFIGPLHSASIKALIGVVIGCAIQHRFMAPAIKNTIKANEELLDRFFEDGD
ncbi:hypothetical protein EEL50_12355 [Muribaculaceae bacterium Isolate-105 (HZI)]|nr:hypothetical protein EEL50_12355 [Muribaculaceae bacterium Isolate-105 (HZI)]